MARSKRILILTLSTLLAACIAGPAWAEEKKAEKTSEEKAERRLRKRNEPPSPEFDNVRRAIDALTPEQRKKFQENFIRWSNLPPDEKRALRDRDEMRRRRIANEIEEAMAESGLSLDEAQKKAFTMRYIEERKKIEERLRRETDERRAPLLQDLTAQLKAEFSGQTSTTQTTSGTGAGQ